MKKTESWRVVLLLAAGLTLGVPASAQTLSYRVIVNAENPIGSVSRQLLLRIFLKQTTQWPDGQAAQPVDQAEGASVRDEFSSDVLGRTVPAVKSFWQRQIFSGAAVPPVEKDSDTAVIAFVRLHAGAVGYVGSGTLLPPTVKVLRVTER